MKTGKVIRSPKKVNYKGALKCNPIGTLTAMYNAEKVGKVYGPILENETIMHYG